MPTDPNTLPPVPRGSLMEWMARRPDEVRAYLDAVRSITRAPGLQRARQNAILPTGTVVQSTVVPAPTPSGEYTVPVMNWTIRTSPSSACGWRAVCWSPQLHLFVAVANSGTGQDRIMTSPDGVTWTTRTAPATTQNGILCDGSSICWAAELGLFVAVSAINVKPGGTSLDRVITSADGITWTVQAAGAALPYTGICWSPELHLLVAVASGGTGNRVMTSPDGITWTARTSAADTNWRAVCWSKERGLFVAVATNAVMTSPDGITWTSQVASPIGGNWNSVVWAPELKMFLAVSNNSGTVMTSFDGIAWTPRPLPVNVGFFTVVWAAELGLFVVVGQNGTLRRCVYSEDGIKWYVAATPADNQWWGLCWAPELSRFVAVSDTGSGNRVMTGTVTDL